MACRAQLAASSGAQRSQTAHGVLRSSHRGKPYAKNAGEIDMYFDQGPGETAGEIEPS